MNNNIDFINFPENVEKFNGVITHKIGLGNTKLDFKQDNEQELKIKLKYLLAYQEALYKIGNHLSGPINSEIIYITSTLFDLFNPVKGNIENFLDRPVMEQKALNLDVEEIWNNNIIKIVESCSPYVDYPGANFTDIPIIVNTKYIRDSNGKKIEIQPNTIIYPKINPKVKCVIQEVAVPDGHNYIFIINYMTHDLLAYVPKEYLQVDIEWIISN